MRLIKNREIIIDSWTFVADGSPTPNGDIVVTYNHWLTHKETLLNHAGEIGISINIEDNLDVILSDLDNFSLIFSSTNTNFSSTEFFRSEYELFIRFFN